MYQNVKRMCRGVVFAHKLCFVPFLLSSLSSLSSLSLLLK